VHRQVGLPIAVEIERVEGDRRSSYRLLDDAAPDRLSPAGGADHARQTDIDGDKPDLGRTRSLHLEAIGLSIITGMVFWFVRVLHGFVADSA